MDGAIVSNPSDLLEAWTHHFCRLAKSQVETNLDLEGLMKQSTTLLSESFQKEEVFLDIPFTAEEVHHAVNNMKPKKSAGPDDITAEHLKYGGETVIVWLTGVLNSVVDTEQVPACLKQGYYHPHLQRWRQGSP